MAEGISWPAASFLLVNLALGTGVLNFPFAYDKAGGIYFALFLQLVLIALLISTMLMLVHCSDIHQDKTYHSVLLSMCGKRAQRCSALTVMLTCYGICITFLIIIGDQYDRIFLSLYGPDFKTHFYLNRRFTIAVTATLFIWPLSYFHKLEFLRHVSTLGVLVMLYSVFLTTYEFYTLDAVPGAIKIMPESFVEVMMVLPIMSFAYQTHELVVPIYASMKNRNIRNFIKATLVAMCILLIIYCCAGSFGYLTFGSDVQPNIMIQYEARDPIVLIGVGSLAFKMVTTYPLLLLCGRETLDGLYAECTKLIPDEFAKGEYKRRVIITTTWFTSALLIAIFTPDIQIVMEFLGCLASINVFIFPGLCLISLVSRNGHGYENSSRYLLLAFAVFIVLFGIFICVIVFIQAIMLEIKTVGVLSSSHFHFVPKSRY